MYVLVFGSNQAGVHGSGAAAWAARFYGAKRGIGEGFCGQSYALPTKNYERIIRPLDDIYRSVFKLFAHAKETPQNDYHITRVGCGLGGYSDAEIFAVFQRAEATFGGKPANIHYPGVWVSQFIDPSIVRVAVAGSISFHERAMVEIKLSPNKRSPFLDRFYESLSFLLDWRAQGYNVEVVSGLALGPDKWGLLYAKHHGLSWSEWPAEWNTYKKPAGIVRNCQMALHSSHAFITWDGKSKGSAHMNGVCMDFRVKTTLVTIHD